MSFFHGSNDGQKRMGLVVLILAGILPAQYALNPASKASDIQAIVRESADVAPCLEKLSPRNTDIKGMDANGNIADYLKTDGRANEQTYAGRTGRSMKNLRGGRTTAS